MKKICLLLLLLSSSRLWAQDTLAVICSEDAYNGDAIFSLAIDGKVVTAVNTCTAKNTAPGVPAGPTQTFTFKGNWGGSAVAHSVVTTFLNDAYGGSAAKDRNLFIRSVTFNGVALSPRTTQGLYNNGKATFTFTPAPVLPAPPSGTTALPTRSVILSWTASTSTVVSYNMYRASVSGGPYTKIGATKVPTTNCVDTLAVVGQTYYYVTTAVDASGNESSYSNEAKAVIPGP